MPEIRRVSMVPARIERDPLKRVGARMRRWISGNAAAHDADAGPALDAGWRRVARRRRIGLAATITTSRPTT